jgi:hypothetical protein
MTQPRQLSEGNWVSFAWLLSGCLTVSVYGFNEARRDYTQNLSGMPARPLIFWPNAKKSDRAKQFVLYPCPSYQAQRPYNGKEHCSMFRLDAEKSASFCDGLRRRDFLHAGALSLLGFSLTDLYKLRVQGTLNPDREMNCIFLMLVGGPSQLDCWDLKPHALAEIRWPYKPIRPT